MTLRKLRKAFAKAPHIDAVCALARQFAHDNGPLEPGRALRFTRNIDPLDERYPNYARLRVIDALTQCHGVESFESVGGYWEYVNAGDSYVCTVLLSPGGRFFVESWGDRVERPSHDRWHRNHTWRG